MILSNLAMLGISVSQVYMFLTFLPALSCFALMSCWLNSPPFVNPIKMPGVLDKVEIQRLVPVVFALVCAWTNTCAYLLGLPSVAEPCMLYTWLLVGLCCAVVDLDAVSQLPHSRSLFVVLVFAICSAMPILCSSSLSIDWLHILCFAMSSVILLGSRSSQLDGSARYSKGVLSLSIVVFMYWLADLSGARDAGIMYSVFWCAFWTLMVVDQRSHGAMLDQYNLDIINCFLFSYGVRSFCLSVPFRALVVLGIVLFVAKLLEMANVIDSSDSTTDLESAVPSKQIVDVLAMCVCGLVFYLSTPASMLTMWCLKCMFRTFLAIIANFVVHDFALSLLLIMCVWGIN